MPHFCNILVITHLSLSQQEQRRMGLATIGAIIGKRGCSGEAEGKPDVLHSDSALELTVQRKMGDKNVIVN